MKHITNILLSAIAVMLFLIYGIMQYQLKQSPFFNNDEYHSFLGNLILDNLLLLIPIGFICICSGFLFELLAKQKNARDRKSTTDNKPGIDGE